MMIINPMAETDLRSAGKDFDLKSCRGGALMTQGELRVEVGSGMRFIPVMFTGLLILFHTLHRSEGIQHVP